MRRTFFELITQFTEQNGCSCELKEGQCQASFNAEGLKVHLGLLESSGMLIIQTGVGILPDDHREAFMMDLLTANNLYSGTQGLTLGVDKETELVTLQLVWEMEHLDNKRFTTLMGNLLVLAAEWLERLGSWEASVDQPANAEESSLTTPGTMLRI